MQHRHRLYAGQQGRHVWLAAMASSAVDGDRRLEQSHSLLRSTSARSVWSVHNRAATGPVPPSLHGPISAHEHPNAADKLARGATADDIIGNRIYAAWGVGDDGVLQILDRKKLLPPLAVVRAVHTRATRTTRRRRNWSRSLAGILYMSPDQGGHTSMPVFGLKPPSYQAFTRVPDARHRALGVRSDGR